MSMTPQVFYLPCTFWLRTGKHEKALRFIQALLLYLPSLFFLTNRYLVVFIAFSILAYGVVRWERRDWAFFLFAAYVFLNTALGVTGGALGDFSIANSNGMLGCCLLVLSYMAARTINADTLRYFLVMVCAEAALVMLQARMGIRVSFAAQLVNYVGVPYSGSPDLASYLAMPMSCVQKIYTLQPMGLNVSSLLMAVKLILGLIILAILPMRPWVRCALYAFLSAGLLIVYCRAAMVALAVFTCVWIVYEALRPVDRTKRLGLVAASIIGMLALTNTIMPFCPGFNLTHTFLFDKNVRYPDQVYPVFGNAEEEIETAMHSGLQKPTKPPAKTYRPEDLNFLDRIIMKAHRMEIWRVAIDGIIERPWLGNHSVREVVYDGLYTNNAYLGILYTHGFVGAALLGLFYFRRIFEHWNRFWLLLPLLTFNLTDDTLFWYMSHQDMMALYILTIHAGGLFLPQAKTH